MKPIFIIGYMCSGKTTFGSALAHRMGLTFIDLDDYISGKWGKSISDLFREEGEEGFRLIEREALHEVAGMEDVIVACGGGTPCFFDNIDHINRCGLSVFLETSLERLLLRLEEGKDSRPLVAGKDAEQMRAIVVCQLTRRAPFYHKAACKWSGEKLDSLEEIEENVEKFLSVALPHFSL